MSQLILAILEKKTIDIQPLIDIKDGYGLKTTARSINGLITAIVKYEEQFYKDEIGSINIYYN